MRWAWVAGLPTAVQPVLGGARQGAVREFMALGALKIARAGDAAAHRVRATCDHPNARDLRPWFDRRPRAGQWRVAQRLASHWQRCNKVMRMDQPRRRKSDQPTYAWPPGGPGLGA